MDIQIEKVLTESGFSRGEAKTYIALLDLKEANASEISKKSQIHRVNIYDILKKLEEKGLVSEIIINSKKIYRPSNPDHLVEVINQKKEALLEVIPLINKKMSDSKKEQQVFYLTGAEGVLKAYNMMLNENSEILGLGGSGFTRKYLGYKHDVWNKVRLKKKIPMRTIYYEFTRDDKEKSWKEKTVKIRYLPDSKRTPCMIDICGSLIVNLIPQENTIQTIVIRNQNLADTFKTFFEEIWKIAKE
ncbi:MAG: TrmB family transcriptional regulator [Candidatus Iainarchaeum sp.]